MRYTYLGDKLTRGELKGAQCDPERRSDGRVIRGRNRNQLVRMSDGTRHVVVGRRLRVNRSDEASGAYRRIKVAR